MLVFVTGGTGLVGSAVVRDLLAAGHEALGLARSDRSAAALETAGARPHRGSLESPDSLRSGAERADGVVHTAFDNSGTRAFLRGGRTERAALTALGQALRGTGKPLVAAGGFAPVRPAGPVLVESDPVSRLPGPTGRNVERSLTGLAHDGVRAAVVRLAAVHGAGDRFTVRHVVDLARRHGFAAFPGDGRQRVAAVQREDAARLFRLALEHAAASAPEFGKDPLDRWHGVGEEGVPFREVAEAVGDALGLPVRSLGAPSTLRYFGVYAGWARGGRPVSAALTREELGWRPRGIGLVEDLRTSPWYTGGPRER